MGYLGGVSWAILTVKICQMFPNYQPSRLVEAFFDIFSKCQWEKTPIFIESIKDEPNLEKINDD